MLDAIVFPDGDNQNMILVTNRGDIGVPTAVVSDTKAKLMTVIPEKTGAGEQISTF